MVEHISDSKGDHSDDLVDPVFKVNNVFFQQKVKTKNIFLGIGDLPTAKKILLENDSGDYR